MPTEKRHIQVLDKKVTELSDALAHLGKGTDLKELLRIIRKPGWTTPAELTFAVSIVDTLQVQVRGVEHLCSQLLEGARQVGVQGHALDVGAGLAASRPSASSEQPHRTN